MKKNIENLKFAYHNAGSLFLMKLFGIGINYLVLILILYFFGLFGNGKLAEFIAFSKAIMILIVFGIDVVLVKKLNYKNKENIQIIATTVAFIFNILIFAFIFIIGKYVFSLSYTIFIGGVLLACWRYISNFFRGKNNMIAYGFFEFILFYLTILTSILCAKTTDLYLIQSILIINIVVLIFVVGYLFNKYKKIIWQSINSKNFKQSILGVYKESYHFVLSTSIILISTAIVYKIIESNYSTEALGAYDTILKFSQIIVLPLVATNGRVMVTASKHFFGNELNELKDYVIKITKMLVITSTLCALVSFLAFYIFTKYFNTNLKPYWFLFLFISLAQLINNWAGPAETILQVTNNIKSFNKAVFIATLYLVLSTYIFTTYLDIEIVGINMIVYMFLFNFASLMILKKRLGINAYKM